MLYERGPAAETGSDSERRSGEGLWAAAAAGGGRARGVKRGDMEASPASREPLRPLRGVSEHMAEPSGVDGGGRREVASPDTAEGGPHGTAHALWHECNT